MTTYGAIDVDCPVCGHELEVPLLAAIGPRDAATLGVTLELDRAYLHAHELTHGPHGGQPLPIAA